MLAARVWLSRLGLRARRDSRVRPGRAGRRVTAHYLAERGADLDRVDRWIELLDRTFDEDKEAVEIQQRGLRTGRLAQMRYVSDREAPVIFFNNLIWDAYKQALDG